jgi:hypothetical protein
MTFLSSSEEGKMTTAIVLSPPRMRREIKRARSAAF